MRAEIDEWTFPPGALLPSRNELCARFAVSGITAQKAPALLCQQGHARAVQGRGHIVRRPRSRIDIPAGTLVRVRHALYNGTDGQPIQVHVSWIPDITADQAEALGLEDTAVVLVVHATAYDATGTVIEHTRVTWPRTAACIKTTYTYQAPRAVREPRSAPGDLGERFGAVPDPLGKSRRFHGPCHVQQIRRLRPHPCTGATPCEPETIKRFRAGRPARPGKPP